MVVAGLTTLTLRLDPLSAAFVLVTGLVLFPASIFAGGELRRESFRGRERVFTVMLLALYASLVLILIAGDALLFLLAWEVMSILCYLLVVTSREGDNGHVGAGYLLLAMGEAGTLAACTRISSARDRGELAGFRGSQVRASALGPTARWAVFLLSFFGFGVKAGLVPVNFWLPRAYVAAPRGVCAGARGRDAESRPLRHFASQRRSLAGRAGGHGLGRARRRHRLGAARDPVRDHGQRSEGVLAHSSIENVGIVVAGFGAGMVFVATNHPALAAIAFVAALYHMTNHSLYKTLLFFGVGAVEAQTGTRDIDRLGGLIKWMPLTALGFLVGTLSIAALPPFNGFVSEWLTLQTMLRSADCLRSARKSSSPCAAPDLRSRRRWP